MHETNRIESRPWEAPLWRTAPGKEGVLAYLIGVHLLALVGIILFPIPSLPVFATTLALTLAGGLGTTVCYHRYLAHRTLKLNPVVEQVLILFTVLNGSGDPAPWAANHRLHHAKADTDGDVSSPTHGGFWWAHLRWLYQTSPAEISRWAPDLARPRYSIWSRLHTPLILLSIFGGLAFGWEAFFWIGAIRLVYSLHFQCFVNSVMHMGEMREQGGSAKNIWWLGPLQLAAWGENWHGNHHRFANSARLGLRWYQVDVGWYVIWALERVGLARGVKRPDARDDRSARVLQRDAA